MNIDSPPPALFMSYSHSDEDLRDELEKHLSALRRQGEISTWHDRRIGPDEDIHAQISAQLDSVEIVLLLVSVDFLASDYCYDIEMKRAMQRHDEANARVIPVILRPCNWHGAPFGRLKAVPTDGKPITKHATFDGGFLEVAQAVRQAAESLARPIRASMPGMGSASSATPMGPRSSSSNLRVKKEFTDRERHTFLTDAFEYVARYFENSLSELQSRNKDLETDFRRIDTNPFEAIAFVSGREQSRCGIWLSGLTGTDGISFSYNGVGSGNSYNESTSVRDDGYRLYLEPIGMTHLGQRQDLELTHEGAAEYFWSLFVERLR